MFSLKARTAVVIMVASSLAPRALAQQPATTPTPAPQATAARTPDYVDFTGFKGKVFEVRYREPRALLEALRPLGSGFKGATISHSDEFKTLTVRDFPENIAAMEESLKRLDKPEALRPDIEFAIHVLIASNAAVVAPDNPAELNDVIKQLQSALRYKFYGLMTSSIQRTKEGPSGVNNSGVTESKMFAIPQPEGYPTFYGYNLQRISIDSASGTPVVNIGDFRFNMRIPLSRGASVQYENIGFGSPVSLRQGERVVVGSTTMGDKGLVVIISARIVK
ncbi:MAG TPA: hypothetical protein VI837_06035 [Blastocatellia bacterium]|nr:hypothetical protein [Blastocatellia bacterium]